MTKINTLIDSLRVAKEKLAEQKEAVLQAEITLYEALKEQIPAEGTLSLGALKIKTGFYQKWSQESLIEARRKYPSGEPFPFSMVYEPDNKQLKYLAEYRPELYEIVRPALSLTPKKPSFEIKGGKDE
jgi:hypothetical protein